MTTERKQLILAWYGLISPKDVDGIWGKQSQAATKKLQGALGIEQDGDFGPTTAAEVWHAIFEGRELVFDSAADSNAGKKTGTFWDHIRYWTREEFRCRCGEYHAPYCDGFPAEPDKTLVELLDDIRAHFGRPAHRSSGLRCPQHNRDSKGVANSKHLYGKAMDFYIDGIPGETVRAYAAKDPRCTYTYVVDGNVVHVDVA